MKSAAIPVINVAELHRGETLRALDCACRNWGAFLVVEHGIDESVLRAMQAAMEAFFALSPAQKQAISRSENNPWGFYDRELTKNIRDWKQVFDYGPEDDAGLCPQWPAGLPGFRTAVLDFYNACNALAHRLLGAIATNLGVAPDWLRQYFESEPTSFVRLNYYPVCPGAEPENELAAETNKRFGVNHHTDAGALTLLLQDSQPGLEILHQGCWQQVAPRPHALLVNLGDILQVWSNDRYCAPVHRVVASSRAARYSAPFFFNPAYNTEYRPLSTTVDELHPARYHSINWGEFRQRRAMGDYADYGEEVQISHYRVLPNSENPFAL